MLCFVKDVHLDPNKLEDTAKELRYIYDVWLNFVI